MFHRCFPAAVTLGLGRGPWLSHFQAPLACLKAFTELSSGAHCEAANSSIWSKSST